MTEFWHRYHVGITSVLRRCGWLLVGALVWAATHVSAGSDRAVQFAGFALDRCIMPVVAGVGAHVSGLQPKEPLQVAARAETRALQESRRVYGDASRGFLLLVPAAGGCTALALSVPAQEVRAAVDRWARNDIRLTPIAGSGPSTDTSTAEYRWQAQGREVQMLVRTDDMRARAAIVMTEGK